MRAMSQELCCVPGCFIRQQDDVPLHCFPNPKTNAEQFEIWTKNIGGEVASLDIPTIHNNRRVCHRHFTDEHKLPQNRLSLLATPVLNLSTETSKDEIPVQNHKKTSKRNQNKTSRKCEVCGMREAHSSTHVFLANFPLDEERCRKWIQMVGNEDLVYLPIDKLHRIKFVCGNHFERSAFNRNGNRLRKYAVPRLQMTRSPLSDTLVAEFPLPVESRPGIVVPIKNIVNNEDHNYTAIPDCDDAVECSSPGSHKVLHLFPNPKNEKERFNDWLMAIGGQVLSLNNEFIYKRRRVCHAHFAEKYCCRLNRISNIAIPTLNISDYKYVQPKSPDNAYLLSILPDYCEADIKDEALPETENTEIDKMPVRACRGCLATEPKLYNIYKNNLYEVFGEAVGNPIFESDDLPQHICAMCYAQLMKYVSFRSRCLLVQDLLEDLKLQGITVTTSFIRKIDRNKCNLLPNLKQVRPPTSDLIIQEELPYEPVPVPQVDAGLDHKPVEPLPQSPSAHVIQKELDKPPSLTEDEWPEEPLPEGPHADGLEEPPLKSTPVPPDVSIPIPKPTIPLEYKSDSGSHALNIEELKNKFNMDVKVLTKEEQIQEMKDNIFKLSTQIGGRPYCPDCGKTAVSADRLQKHIKKWHDEAVGPIQCEVCRCRFKSQQCRHICNKFIFKCNKCGVIFKHLSRAKKHARRHAQNYNCRHCKSVFATYDLLKSHVYIDHHAKLLWCKCCGESFINSVGLNLHSFRVHEKDLKHACQKCNIKFLTSEALEKHSSLTCENFNCVMCGEHFESELLIKDHVIKEHSRCEYIKLAHCDGCGVKFYGNDPLVKHLELKCCGSGYPCLVCGQNFLTSESVYNHQIEHNKLYRACESCDKAFDAHNYRHHISRVHNITPPKHQQGMHINTTTKVWSVQGCIIKGEEKNPSNFTQAQAREGHLMCHYCGKTFKKNRNMMLHTLQHTGERPYVCATCGRSYIRKEDLMRHELLHTGEKPHACHVCPKRFRLQSALKRHLVCHSEVRRHVCQVCGKSFRTSTSVKIHIKGVHLHIPARKPRNRVFLEQSTQNQEDNLETQGLLSESTLPVKTIKRKRKTLSEEPTDGHIQGLVDKDITQVSIVYDDDAVVTDAAVPRIIKTVHLKRKRRPQTSDLKAGEMLTQEYMDREAYGTSIESDSKIRKKTIKKPGLAKKMKHLKAIDSDLTQNYMDMHTQGFEENITQDLMDRNMTQGCMDYKTQENMVYGTLSRTIPAAAIKKTINLKQKKVTERSMPSLDLKDTEQVYMDSYEQVADGQRRYFDASSQDGAPNPIMLGQQDFRGGQKKYVIIASAAKNSQIVRKK